MVFSLHIRRAQVGLGLLVGITLAATIANNAKGDSACELHWQPFTSGEEMGVAAFPTCGIVWNGDLIVGGRFAAAGGQTVNHLRRWDGSEWHPLTTNLSGSSNNVIALTEWNGDLIAGGAFFTAGGQNVRNIARWDGTEWHPFTSGGQIGVGEVFPAGQVNALTVYNGDLIAGGSFVTAGGQDVNYIARWDGTQWHPFTSGGQSGMGPVQNNMEVIALTVYDGDLIAGGRFITAGGQTVNHIARWDGMQWHPFIAGGQTGVGVLGVSTFQAVASLTVYDGDLIVGGRLQTAGGQTVNRIARWDGSEWHPLASGGQIGMSGGDNTQVHALTVWNYNLIASGRFTTAGGQTVNNIARWNGYSWQPFVIGCDPIGVDGVVMALPVYDGDLVAIGHFITAGGQTVNRIVTWKACPLRGACCVNGAAVELFADECAAIGGVFFGEEVPPEYVECAPASPSCPADLNGDGVINGADLLQLLTAWGICP